MKRVTRSALRKGCFAVSLVSLLFLFVESSFAQVSWTKHGSPVLSPGTSGQWDDQLVAPGTVVFQDSVYKMWYSGYDGITLRIGYATSPDGMTWTKHGDPILNVGASGNWDCDRVYIPRIDFDGSSYRMWYIGGKGTYEQIGYATSSDGVNWTKYANNPVMPPGASGKWDGSAVCPGPVVYDTMFHMIYNGFSDGNTCRGGYATSSDGVRWTKSSNPVLNLGSWDTPRVQVNSLLHGGPASKYYAFYGGGDLFGWGISYATADDLSGPWTKLGSKILDATAGAWDSRFVGFPCVLYDSTIKLYKMWYLGGSASWTGSVGYATAPLVVPDTIKVPADYAAIQTGIDAAKDGDLVLVSEGTYYENIRFRGKKITLGSQYIIDGDTSHISKTIIDGSHSTDPDSGSTVYFVSGEDSNSVLCGFKITGGTGTNVKWGLMSEASNDRDGGGIYATSGPRISHNLITGNSISLTTVNGAYGGGIACLGDAIVEYNEITRNSLQSQVFQVVGGGIFVSGSSTRVICNSITDNVAQTDATTGNVGGGGVGVMYYNQTVTSGAVVFGNLVARNKALAPNAVYECQGGGIMSFSTSGGTEIINNKVVDNVIESKSGARGGGICVSSGEGQLVKNNLVTGNSASVGGGVCFYGEFAVSRVPTFINNTVVSNHATGGSGSGISSHGNWTPVVQNSIIWGNGGSTQMSGNLNVQYCDVEGGYSGNGNLSADPRFVDSLSYCLQDTSQCVDTGNPDPRFNDIEDPANPGFALAPALGTVRNDMGAYGGNPSSADGLLPDIRGPQFSAFANHVSLASQAERQAIVDSFMTAAAPFPFIEQKKFVYYLYKGTAGSVTVPGDANNWDMNACSMTNLYGTDLWYYEASYESDARLDYKFLVNGATWMVDPRNPNQIPGPYDPNSELAMPDYVQPLEIEDHPAIPHGTIDAFSFTSKVLGNTRTIKVYTPPGYSSEGTERFPVFLLHDGLDFLTRGYVNNTLDYLISNKRIRPTICVFVPPINDSERESEYATTKADKFETFIVDELMPHIDSTYRTMSNPSSRGMGGYSYGGLITTQICYNHPEEFGLAIVLSPGYVTPDGMSVFDNVLAGPCKNIKWYIDWGTYEPSTIIMNAKSMAEGLKNKGYRVASNEWHEAHSIGSWRAHLDNAMDSLYLTGVRQLEGLPRKFSLYQNYPNPFNPMTTIRFEVPRSGFVSVRVYDVLGREVKTLVSEVKKAGRYEVQFDASSLASGVYFYRIKAGTYTSVKKMLMLK